MQAVVLLYDVLRILHCPFLPDGIGDVTSVREFVELLKHRGTTMEVVHHRFVITSSNGGFVWMRDDQDLTVVLRNRTAQLVIVIVQFSGVDYLHLNLPIANTQNNHLLLGAFVTKPQLSWWEQFMWRRRFGQYETALTARLQTYLQRDHSGDHSEE